MHITRQIFILQFLLIYTYSSYSSSLLLILNSVQYQAFISILYISFI